MIGLLAKKAPPRDLKTARLILRRHKLPIAETLYAIIEHERDHLGRFLPWVEQTTSVQDERLYIANANALWERCEGFDFGVFLAATGQLIGNASVHTISWRNQHAEIGYWMSRDFEGHGYMTEAVDVLTRAMFTIGFHRMEIRCDSENTRSAGVPKRLGYRLEASLEDETIVSGHFRNTLVFSVLRSRYVSTL